jgi:MSHA biogenesis protein MshN
VSVINRVLVDLEKRHARSGDPRPGTTEIRAVDTPSDRGSRRSLVAVLFAIAVVALGLVAWQWASIGIVSRSLEPAQLPVVQTAASPAPATTPAAVVEVPAAVVLPAPAPVIPVKVPQPRIVPLARAANANDPETMPETPPVARPAAKTPKAAPEIAAASETPIPAAIEKRDRPPSAAERADAQFRQGAQAMQQGHMRDAEASFLAAIAEDSGHVPARQALLGVYLESQRKDEAEVLVRDGIKAGNRPTSWVMLLARLEADRGDLTGAVTTMRSHLDIGRQNGDYLSLLAALLQKQGQHKEAVEQYQAAIALGAGKPPWFMGLGISLQALGRRDEAKAAFQRALDSGGLSPDLKVFVERQMAALRAAPAN